MTIRPAFTLLEVLFAIVLLAVVVAVCVPFLRAPVTSDSEAERSVFLATIDEEIARFSRSNHNGPTDHELSTIFQPIGIECVKFGDHNELLDGQWVRLSDGRFETTRWAPAERVRPEGTQ